MIDDILNLEIPLEGVETELPLIPAADYPLQCAESSVGPNKDGNGHNWKLRFVNVNPIVAVDKREIPAQKASLFLEIALQPAPESTDPEGFKRQLGDAMDAFYGTTKANRPPFKVRQTPQDVLNKVVVGTVYLDEWPKGSKSFRAKIRKIRKLPAATF